MIIISYDIADDKIRTRFSKMLTKQGAVRLQYSVYEMNNTKRLINNLKLKIEAYAKHFSIDDSVVIFDVYDNAITKYGNAIHRDKDIVFL
ncbi:MAG: CRISPR-associated endonuclease Cas2 [Bacteroidales bacterium]|nr:CRISPR-associated endonuclease Cas2 [Bacteroidales bacterium]